MNRRYMIAGLLIVLCMVVVTLVLYPHLPPVVPIHWNAGGHADGYGRRQVAVWVIPAIMIAVIILFRFLPWLSPQNFEMEPSGNATSIIMLAILGFLGYLQVVLLRASLGHPVRMGRLGWSGIFVLIAVLGIFLPKMQQNFYIGIRTPWTLANKKVWDQTHQFSGMVFIIVGIVGFFTSLIRTGPAFQPLILLAATLISVVLYSFIYYKLLERWGTL